MDEELDKAIKELIEAGVSDDEIKKFINDYSPQTKDNGVSGLSHFAGQFNKGAYGLVSSALRGGGELASKLEHTFGEGKLTPQETSMYQLGELVDKSLESVGGYATNPQIAEQGGVKGFLMNDLPSGLGSTTAFLAATASGNPESALPALEGQVMTNPELLKQTALAGGKLLTSKVGALGGTAAIDQAYQEAKASGASDDTAMVAGLQNYIGGATEGIPLERILGRLTKVAGGRGVLNTIFNTVKQMGAGGFEEGLQEGLQQYWQNMVAKGNYDPDRDPMINVLRSATSAGIIGALIPFVGNIPNISLATKDKIIKKLEPQTLESEYNVQHPEPKVDAAVDNEFAIVAKNVDKLLEDYNINLTKEENEILSPQGNREAAVEQRPAEPNIQPAPGIEPAANGQNIEEPKVETPKINNVELYHTSTQEIKDIGEQAHNNGVMHLWRKGSDKSVGLFAVAPSLTGEIAPDSRADAATVNGAVEEANANFPASKFGNKTTKIEVNRKLNLLRTKDSGQDLHLDEIIASARKSKAVDQVALDNVLKRTEQFDNNWDKQASLAAFLRTPEGGNYDGILYTNTVERKVKKAVAPVEEDNQIFIDKADNIIKRRRPSQVIEALNKLNERIEAKGLTKAKEYVSSQIASIEKKKTELVPEPKAEKPEVKEEPKKEVKTATYKGTKKSLNTWKDFFYKKIGSAQTEYARGLALDRYNEFREENGLKKITAERASQIARSEVAVRENKKAAPQRRAQPTSEERNAAKQAAKEAIAKEFGLNADDIENISFTGEPTMYQILEESFLGDVLKMPKQEIHFGEYLKLAPLGQQDILKSLNRVIEQYKIVENTGVKFIKITVPKESTVPSLGGFHFSLAKTDNSYIGVLVDERTGMPIHTDSTNTVLHEYIHEYTKMMFHRLYASNRSFKKAVVTAFDDVVGSAKKATTKLLNKLIFTEQLTSEDDDLIVLLSTITDLDKITDMIGKTRKDYLEGGTKKTVERAVGFINDAIYRDFYAFTNPLEMLAEAFSNPLTVNFLSNIKLDETVKTGINKGERKSLLYKWYEQILDWAKSKFAYTEVGKVANNTLDHFMDVIGSFDEEFINGDLKRRPEYGMFMFAGITPEMQKEAESNYKHELISLSKKVSAAKKIYRKIVNNLVYTMEGKEGIKTLEDVKQYLNGVNSHLTAGKKIDVENYAPRILGKIKRLRKQRELAKQHQTKLIANAKAHPVYKTSWKFRDDVEDFAAVNIDDLKLKIGNNEVMAYINGLGNLSINGIVPERAYNIMINYGKKAQMLKALSPLSGKLHQTFMGGLENWSNPATFSSILSKYDTKTADAIMKTVYGGSMKSMSRASLESNNLFKGINEMAEKSNFTHKDLAVIGMYGGIMSTVAEPDSAEWRKEVLANAQAALESAENKLKAKEEGNYRGDLSKKLIQNEVEIAKDILAKVKAGNKVLSTAQDRIYNSIKDFAALHEDDFMRNSIGAWGNAEFQKRYNYFPTLAQGSINKGGQIRESELLRGEADNLFEALSSEGRRGTYGQVYGKKVWSNYRRTNPKGYFYENDALAIAKRWSKSMLYDLYSTKELKAINRVLEDKQFQSEFKVRTRDAFKTHLRSIAGSGNRYNPEVSGIWRAALKGRDKLYTAALATSGQILLQSSSGFAAAAVLSAHLNPVTATKSFAKAVSAAADSTFKTTGKLQKFLEKEGLGIQLRDILFEKYLSAEDYQNYLAGIKVKGLSNKIENITEWALRSGDKLGARLVWFAAYFNAGGTLENPNRDAVLAAERMTGIMQNMSDLSFSAPAFKYNSASQKILMGMFFAFKSFSINSALNIWYSSRFALDSSEARAVLAGQIGSIIAYHTMAQIAIRPLYAALVSGLTGDDGEDKKRVGDLETILAESLWDLGIGMWSPSMLDGLLRYFYNKTAAPTVHGSPYEEYDQYLDSPIYSVKEPDDLYRDLLGPGFKEMGQFGVDGIKLLAEEMAADKFLEEAEKASKRDEDWNLFVLRTIGTIYGGISGMPLRGDMKRILEAVARKRKAQRARDKKNSTNGGSSEPLYTFPEYEINNSDLR